MSLSFCVMYSADFAVLHTRYFLLLHSLLYFAKGDTAGAVNRIVEGLFFIVGLGRCAFAAPGTMNSNNKNKKRMR